MAFVVKLFFIFMFSLNLFSEDYRLEFDSDYVDSYGNERDITVKQKYNYDYDKKFKGTIDSDGDVRLRNNNGESLRGNIDEDGYGYLRDQDGNRIRVRP